MLKTNQSRDPASKSRAIRRDGGMAVFSKCPYIERGMEKPGTGLRVSLNSWQLKFLTILARPLKLCLGILSSPPFEIIYYTTCENVEITWLQYHRFLLFVLCSCFECPRCKKFLWHVLFFILDCQRVNSRLAPKSISPYIAGLPLCTLRMGKRKYFRLLVGG